jgi:O-antigen ligase
MPSSLYIVVKLVSFIPHKSRRRSRRSLVLVVPLVLVVVGVVQEKVTAEKFMMRQRRNLTLSSAN